MAKGEVELKPGDVFAGYRIVQKLGPGVMGIVYLARDTLRVRRVALKLLQPELVSDTDYVKLFEEQAEAAMEARHNNVARLFAAGKEEGLLYTASEFVKGDTLARRIERQGHLDPPVVLSLLLTIGKALNYLHSHGIVHGGVNPGNIRLTPMGEVRLVDVGLAKKLVLRPEKSKIKTTVTPVYLAPELVDRPARVDARADIYSLGITAYQALTGKQPFTGKTPHETVLRIMNEPLLPEDMKGIPPELAGLISRMAAKNPDDRPASMLEVIAEMEKMAEKLAPAAVGAGPSASARIAFTRRSARGHQKVLLYVLVCIIFIAAFLIFYLPGKEEGQGGGWQELTPLQQAARALEEARAHESAHPDDSAESARLYREVISAFPDTPAAEKALAAEQRLAFKLALDKVAKLMAQDRLFETIMVYDAFEKHYAGTSQASDAATRKTRLQRQIDDRFRSDLLEAARLAQKGEIKQAVELLGRVETYGSPEQREQARQSADKIRLRASAAALQGAFSGAWQAAEPMLAISINHITGQKYQTARASYDFFLSSPLPEGVAQILKWEEEDIIRLQKVQANFAAVLGDAADRATRTNFTLADGTVISGLVIKGPGGYFLRLAEDKNWYIRSADLAASEVLKLAGMEVEDTEAALNAMLYELYHGSMEAAYSGLEKLAGKLGEEASERYRNKLRIAAGLLEGRTPGSGAATNPHDIRRAAKTIEAAREAIKRKEWDQAYLLLKEVASLSPGEPELPGLLGKAAAGKGLVSEAVQFYRKAVAANPGNPILWNELGKLYLDQDKLGLALATFRQSTRMNPADPAAARGHVETLLKLGKEEEARQVQEEWEKARQR
jgi:tetratricopeptide (TPR) repeat protein